MVHKSMVEDILGQTTSGIEWIHESNLIEGVDDPKADAQALAAWQWFSARTLNITSVLGAHRRIMQRLDPGIAGKLRRCDVTVGGRICPSWRDVHKLLSNWMERWSLADTELEILLAHVAFEKIHPFVDGNGRTGRMIMSHQRRRIGLLPLLIKSAERWKYYELFDEEDDHVRLAIKRS